MDYSEGITPEDIQVFLEEADEQIQLLEDDLVRLERAEKSDELLQEIFRAAHTLKGSSATLGHQKMAELTHAMENAFDQLRRGAIEVSTELMDVLLEALDVLSNMMEDLRAGVDTEVDVKGIVASINETIRQCAAVSEMPAREHATAIADGSRTANSEARAGAQSDHPAEDKSVPNGRLDQATRVVIEIDKECLMPSVRAFQVVDLLASVGEIVHSVPSLDDIEAGNAEYSLEVYLDTDKSASELKELINQISDLSSVQIIPAADNRSSTSPGPDRSVESREDENRGQTDSAGAEHAAGGSQSGDADQGRTHQSRRGFGSLSTTVRVDVSKLDTLMNLVAELVIDRAQLAQIVKDLENRYDRSDLSEALDKTSLNVGRVTSELQDEIMKIRMLPIDNVFRRFPRMVRDLSQELGREVDFIIEGQDTELDRSVIEEIGDPLIHLLRNAVGHGIEPPEERVQVGKPRRGLVRLRAYHEENSIVIEVEDDGRGIDVDLVKAKAIERGIVSAEAASRLSDREAINLIFVPGLSTAKKVDSIAGRGVGMDIVRTNVERLNGSITVETVKGKGTKFRVKLPLTLAIIRAQLVCVGSNIYAIPIGSVQINLREPESSLKTVRGRETYLYGDRVLPIIRLNDVFGVPRSTSEDGRLFIVVVRSGDEMVGLVVDRLMGQQEIVIKNLGGVVGDIPGLSGVTILGDGRLALILDVPSLIRSVSAHEYAV